MKITMDDIHRLCDETSMEYEEAAALLRQFGGDYRKARRAWQDARSIFIEPVCVENGVRPAGDYIRQAWRKGISLMRRVRLSRLLGLLALIISISFSRHLGGWLLLGIMLARCLPVIWEMLRPLFDRSKRATPHIVL